MSVVMYKTQVNSDGNITLPERIREFLHVKPGDEVGLSIEDNGKVTVKAVRGSFRDLKGMLHVPGRKPLSVEEMNAAVEKMHGNIE